MAVKSRIEHKYYICVCPVISWDDVFLLMLDAAYACDGSEDSKLRFRDGINARCF